MSWIFEKLVEIIAQALAFGLTFLSLKMTNVYALKGSETLHYFFGVFQGMTSANGTSDAGPFGKIYWIFMYTGLAIIFLGMLYNLFKAFFGPLTQAEPPTRTILKSVIFACLCGGSQMIVALIIDITQIPFDAIAGPLQDTSAITNSIGGRMLDGVKNLASDVPAGALDAVLSTFSGVLGLNTFNAIICLIFFMMLFKNFIMLMLEMAERYLMIGLLTIIAPLCIACGAVKAVEDVFKNWLSWMFNACVVLIINTFFMCIFIFNFNARADIPYLCLWIAWIKTGQKIDEHMNSLGLKTAKTGGFGADVMGALLSGLPMALGAADKVQGSNWAGLHKWARGGMQGKMPHIASFDPRKGQRENNLFQKAAQKGLNKIGAVMNKDGKHPNMQDAGTKLMNGINKGQSKVATAASKVGNNLHGMVPGADGKHGKRSGISHDELNKMMLGQEAPPVKGTKEYDNVMKDMMDMKAGKDASGKLLSESLSEKGYSITGMKQEQDGTVSFSAEDKDGNKIGGTLTEGEPGKNSGLIPMEGTDGQARGLAISESQIEGKENPINIGGMETQPTDDRNVAALDGSDGMQGTGTLEDIDPRKTLDGQDASGFGEVGAQVAEGGEGAKIGALGDQVEIGGAKYNLGQEDENGIITGVNTENPNDVKAFQKNEDGSYSQIAEGEKSVMNTTASEVTDSNGNTMSVSSVDGKGNIEAKDADGNTHSFENNKQLGLVETKEAEASKLAGNLRAFSADGQKYMTDAKAGESGVITATNKETGETKNFVQDKDGNIFAANTGNVVAGSKVTDSRNVSQIPNAVTVGTRGEDQEPYNLQHNTDGTITGRTADGKVAAFESTADGVKMIGANGQMVDTQAVAKAGSTKTFSADGQNYVATGRADKNGIFSATNLATGEQKQFVEKNGNIHTAEQSYTAGRKVADSASVSDAAPAAVTVDGQSYNLKPNQNGTFTGTTVSGKEATFIGGADGMRMVTASASVTGSSATATDANGRSFDLKDNGNGTYSGVSSDGVTANFSYGKDGNFYKTSETTTASDLKMSSSQPGIPESATAGGKQYSNFTQTGKNNFTATAADGSTAEFSLKGDTLQATTNMQQAVSMPVTSSGSYISEAMDSNGVSYNLSAQKDGTYRGEAANGKSAIFKDDGAGGLRKIAENREYDQTRGFSTKSVPLNDASVSSGKDGMPSSVSFGKGDDGNYSHVYSKLQHLGGNEYSGTDKNGSSCRFSIDGNNVAMKETVAYDRHTNEQFRVADYAINDVNGKPAVMVSNGSVSAAIAENTYGNGVIVRANDTHEYVRTTNSARYDANGQLDPKGNYMMTEGSNGVKRVFAVETNEGTNAIQTYRMRPDAKWVSFEVPQSDENGLPPMYDSGQKLLKNKDFAANVDYSYTQATGYGSGIATNIIKGDQIYRFDETDKPVATMSASGKEGMGPALAPRYVCLANSPGDYKKLDMHKCVFDENGYLAQGHDIYLEGGAKVNAANLFKGGDGDSSSMPMQYCYATNTQTNQRVALEMHDGAVECATSRSYVNNVPLDLDFSQAVFTSAASEGFCDGRVKAKFPNGDEMWLLPRTAKTDGLQGVYAKVDFNVPGSAGGSGNEVFISPVATSRVGSAFDNYMRNVGLNPSEISQPIDVPTNTASWKMLAREFGIPSRGVSEVKIIPNGNAGPTLQYACKENNKLVHKVVCGYELKGATPEPVKGTNGRSVLGYSHNYDGTTSLNAVKVVKNSMIFFKLRRKDEDKDRRR